MEGRPSLTQLQASPALQAVVIPWAGLPQATRLLLLESPHLSVHNLHHNDHDTAETALALLLAAARRLIPYDQALRQGDWRGRYAPNPSVRLYGKTALLLGYGHIGRRIAAMLLGLGMQVLAVRRQAQRIETTDGVQVHPAASLPDLLTQAQVLVVTLPHTPETEGLIGAQALARLPQGALLVNVGRGPVVEQRALYEALRSGRLGGAGLDVWYHYPADEASRFYTPPADLPFHELDNVVLSPHRAGGSAETEALRMASLAELLNALSRGEWAVNRVDLQAGY